MLGVLLLVGVVQVQVQVGEEELALVEVGEEFLLCEVVVQGWVFLVFLEDT